MNKPNLFIYRIVRWVLYWLYRLLFGFKFFDAQKVPSELEKRGVILAPNHASFLDPPILGISLNRHVTYLAKDYLFKAFFVGWILRSVGAFPIKTQTDDFKTIRELIRLLKEGKCITVFPEGTRSENGELKSPEGGVGFLALKSQAVVVPVYIQGTFKAFPKGAKFFRCSSVKAYYGEPFIPALDEALVKSADPYLAVSQKIMNEILKIKVAVEGTKKN